MALIYALSIVVPRCYRIFHWPPRHRFKVKRPYVLLMGWIRLIHFHPHGVYFTVAPLLVFTGMCRNEYASGDVSVPFWRRAWRKGVISENPLVFFPRKRGPSLLRTTGSGTGGNVLISGCPVLMVCVEVLCALWRRAWNNRQLGVSMVCWMIRLTGNDSLALHFWHRWHVVHYRLRHCACLYRYPKTLHEPTKRDFRHDKWLALVQVITMAEVTI